MSHLNARRDTWASVAHVERRFLPFFSFFSTCARVGAHVPHVAFSHFFSWSTRASTRRSRRLVLTFLVSQTSKAAPGAQRRRGRI